MKAISIIVPVYNVEPCLRQCIDSILAQTFTNFELILVDDGSPDGCPAICDEYAEKDSRVHVIHKENGGVSSARNAGMAVAKGKYFLFCDSDDYVSPQWCEKLFRQIEETPNAWVCCDLERVTESESFMFKDSCSLSVATTYYQIYLMGLSAYAVNKIYDAKKIKDHSISFYEASHISEDVDFNLKYLQCCDCCIFVPQKLYAYVQRQGSVMHKYDPDWFAMHLRPFYDRIEFIGKENLQAYCDIWLYQFLNLFSNTFDERNPASWFKKIAYNQRMLSSKEFQFCLRHASGKNENPIVLRILKTRCYLLYWLFGKAVSIRNKK